MHLSARGLNSRAPPERRRAENGYVQDIPGGSHLIVQALERGIPVTGQVPEIDVM